MKTKEELAGRIRMLRMRARMTQKQVAQILNLDRSTYAYYETATTCPDYETLVRLAKMYQVTTDYLLGLEESPEAGGTIRPRTGAQPLAQADRVDPLLAATPGEREYLLTFRIMAPEEQQKMMAAAQRILNRSGQA